jgi:outer membrane protein with beta-barrel domain
VQKLTSILRLCAWSVLTLSVPAYAQQSKSPPEARLTLGYLTFADESFIDHFVAGGSARFYLTRRLGIEPEFLYLYHSRNDQDFVFVPHLSWDFARRGRVVAYVIGGTGVLWHQGRGSFTARTRATSVGLGAKISISERLFVSPDVRWGWGPEPFFRITGSVGFALSR